MIEREGGGAGVSSGLHSVRDCESSFAGQMLSLGEKLTLVKMGKWTK